VKLNDVVNVDDVIKSGVLKSEDVQLRLLQFLPPEERQQQQQQQNNNNIVNNEESLIQALRSPQFRQAVVSFGHALQQGQHGGITGQFSNLLKSFGFDSSGLTNQEQVEKTGDLSAIEAFLFAVQKEAEKKTQGKK